MAGESAALENRVAGLESRVARLEGQVEQVVKRLDDLRWTVWLWSGLNTVLLVAVLAAILVML